MGRSPCCEKAHTNKGAWTKEEDHCLTQYIRIHGEGCWHSLPKAAGLLRCGKSCRLRWINYLRPDLKRGNFSLQEDELIIKLHSLLGNKWSLIAARLPRRTDNEIKNYWNTHIKRKLISRGIDPQTHRALNYTASGNRSPIKPSIHQLLVSEPGSITHTINFKNSCPDSNNDLRSDSNEGGTCCNSSTTDDSQKTREIDLELSIGLSPFRAVLNSAESKETGPFKPNSISFSPESKGYRRNDDDGYLASGVYRCIWPSLGT